MKEMLSSSPKMSVMYVVLVIPKLATCPMLCYGVLMPHVDDVHLFGIGLTQKKELVNRLLGRQYKGNINNSLIHRLHRPIAKCRINQS